MPAALEERACNFVLLTVRCNLLLWLFFLLRLSLSHVFVVSFRMSCSCGRGDTMQPFIDDQLYELQRAVGDTYDAMHERADGLWLVELNNALRERAEALERQLGTQASEFARERDSMIREIKDLEQRAHHAIGSQANRNVSGAQSEGDDDFLLEASPVGSAPRDAATNDSFSFVAPHQMLPQRRSRRSSSASSDLVPPCASDGGAAQAAIVQEVEREAAYWRQHCVDLEVELQAERSKTFRWKQVLSAGLLQLARSEAVQLTCARATAHAALQRHILQLQPPYADGSGDVGAHHTTRSAALEYLNDSFMQHLSEVRRVKEERGAAGRSDGVRMQIATSNSQHDDSVVMCEEIDRSDSECPPSANYCTPQRLSESTRGALSTTGSAARSLRRQRSAKLDHESPTVPSSKRHGMPSHQALLPRDNPPIARVHTAASPLFVLHAHTKNVLAAVRSAALRSLCNAVQLFSRRRCWSMWRDFTEMRAAQRIGRHSDAFRRRRGAIVCSLLLDRHVTSGTLRRAYDRWRLAARVRYLERQARANMTTVATHSAVIGSMIKNQHQLWNVFVEDVAVLLEHQLNDIHALSESGSVQQRRISW